MGVRAQTKQLGTMSLFENYLGTFKKTSLPINLDRDAVFEIVNNGSRLHEINNSFKRFIPTELLKRNLNSTFKSLYLLSSITSSGMIKKRKKLRGMAILNVGRRDIIILNL